mgnify:CR=1 FL=1
MFDARRFLDDKFKDPGSLLAFLRAYRAPMPREDTARKWFVRGSVPSEWLPVIVAYLEIDAGTPVSLIEYLEPRR